MSRMDLIAVVIVIAVMFGTVKMLLKRQLPPGSEGVTRFPPQAAPVVVGLVLTRRIERFLILMAVVALLLGWWALAGAPLPAWLTVAPRELPAPPEAAVAAHLGPWVAWLGEVLVLRGRQLSGWGAATLIVAALPILGPLVYLGGEALFILINRRHLSAFQCSRLRDRHRFYARIFLWFLLLLALAWIEALLLFGPWRLIDVGDVRVYGEWTLAHLRPFGAIVLLPALILLWAFLFGRWVTARTTRYDPRRERFTRAAWWIAWPLAILFFSATWWL